MSHSGGLSLKKFRSITVKLLIAGAIAVACVSLAVNAVVVRQTRERVQSIVMDQAHANAESIASDLRASLERIAGASRSTAGLIEDGHNAGFLDRRTTRSLLKVNAERLDLAFGSWFAEAPDAFDGRSKNFHGDDSLVTKDGSFNIYWTKTDGVLSATTFESDFGSVWYKSAAESKRGSTTEPYIEPTTGKSMTTVAYPVIESGRLIGVYGIDVLLGDLSARLQSLHPFGSGNVYLLSQAGNWIVAPAATSLLKPYDGPHADLVKEAMVSGSSSVIPNIGEASHFKRLVFPFSLPTADGQWTILLDIPDTALNAPVDEQTSLMVIGGFILLTAVLATMYISTAIFVNRPMRALLADVGALENGAYDRQAITRHRRDEVGQVGAALDRFRQQLALTQTLQEENRREQAIAGALRTQNENERAQSAHEQQEVVECLGRGLSRLAEGDLHVRLNQDFPPNYRALQQDFNLAVEALQGMIGSVDVSVEYVKTNSLEIMSAADQLSRRTERQAAGLEEASAALDRLANQVNQTAGNTTAAARSVKSASSDAAQSDGVVQDAMQAMRQIEESSDEVTRIISVIDGIAFQTNLLALNAGVEAARAGDSGKGFAVVAHEVRELAQRSANAAREIKSLISISKEQVSNGVELVGRAGHSLSSISDQILQMETMVVDISRTSSEQAASIKEISDAVRFMDQATQQNAAMVEELTAASSGLVSEVDSLRQQVVRFSGEHADGTLAIAA